MKSSKFLAFFSKFKFWKKAKLEGSKVEEQNFEPSPSQKRRKDMRLDVIRLQRLTKEKIKKLKEFKFVPKK